jgi:predicted DNA-binding transcriptional regulator YafY
MRADRLLSLVLLLRHRGRMTAPALAAELEVSTRTVLRDVEALSAAGIPVYAERGRAGGFALLPGFSTDLTGLTHDEAVALLTAPSRATSDALGMGSAFSSAIRKVVAAMPESSRTVAEDAAERVLVRRGGWLRDPEPEERVAAVQRAVFAGHRLRIRYTSRHDPDTPGPRWRTVEPIGLVEAAGNWYLLALDGGEDRTYRMSRISDSEELDEPARRPEGVDLEELWRRRRAEFRARRPGLEARVRIAPGRLEELSRTAISVSEELGEDARPGRAAGIPGAGGRGGSADRPPDTGRPVVETRFGDLHHAVRVLWSLAPDAQALAPPELVDALRARAESVARAHLGS